MPQARTAKKVYDHELTPQQHEELLDVLVQMRGFVMISGYDSPLYRQRLKDWNCHEFDIANHSAAAGRAKRRMTECVWCNY